jgi:hypothetical protein
VITPKRILAVLALSVIMLLCLVVAFPDGEIRISDKVSLRFFSLDELLHPLPDEAVDISDILSSQGVDSITPVTDTTAVSHPFRIDVKEIVLVKNKIQYSPEAGDALLSFFKSLDEVHDKRAHVRILHYGDSQLEGDRITSVIREKFQKSELFAGCGAGMIPVRGLIQGRLGFRHTHSENWTEYHPGDGKSPHRVYGLMGQYFMYTPHPPDRKGGADSALTGVTDSLELKPDTTGTRKAWFQVSRYGGGAALSQVVSHVKLLINGHGSVYDLGVSVNGAEPESEHITEKGLLMKAYAVQGKFESVRVEVSGDQSPEVYGICLDCDEGIAVDNIPIRSAGMAAFSMMDGASLGKQVRDLNVKLVMLQFGINVVKNLSDSYGYYEENIYKNIMALKAAAPDVSVLVIGLSDMSRKDGTSMASYPNIATIRDAQRRAAFRSGSAFWDLYAAMGGENSMVSWVNHDPPQAEMDYTHFNPAGARLVGKMIYDALMEEYYKYKGVIPGP